MTESLPMPPGQVGMGGALSDEESLFAAVAAASRALQEESESLQKELAALGKAQQEVRADAEEWETGQKDLDDAHNMITMRKEDLAQLQFLLEARQMGLLSELKMIYPIEKSGGGGGIAGSASTNGSGGNGTEFSIRGIELPPLQEISTSPRDDEVVSAGLGHVVHVLLLASKYLKIPLRYHMTYQSSRSTIRDPLLSAAVPLPLYRRGVERERFERAVILLARNVSQLVQSRGLFYDPGKEMLENLKQIYPCDVCTSLSIL